VVSKEDLISAASELATTIAAQAPQPLSVIKRLVYDGLESPLASALTLEQDATARLIVTDDAHEGIAAFKEKRPPRFPGRSRSAEDAPT
jgi:enoyl-CoA hydratase/carnithine racemase